MRKTNLAVAVDNLESSQLAYEIINELNSIKRNVTVFSDNTSLCCLPNNFALMSSYEMFGFYGTIITTSLKTTVKALNVPSIERIIFFVWDLEFIRKVKNYDEYSKVYLSENVLLVTRSIEHADLIENAFNRKARVVGNEFRLSRLVT